MSANLCWKPADKDYKTLPDALKFILRDKQGLTSEKDLYGRERLGYLRGLVDAGVEGAQELIDAIVKHEHVEIWLEY